MIYPLIFTTSDSYNFGSRQDINNCKRHSFLSYNALPMWRIESLSKISFHIDFRFDYESILLKTCGHCDVVSCLAFSREH